MSRAGVGLVIEQLLTDENLRIRFALDRRGTVGGLSARFRSQFRRDPRRHAAPEGLTAHYEDVSQMSIHIDSCAERETLVVTTSSGVYALVRSSGDRGEVLLRGGRHFTQFRRVLFLGSTAEGGSLDARTIDVGLRMMFIVGDRLFITSTVQSIFRPHARATSTECAAAQ